MTKNKKGRIRGGFSEATLHDPTAFSRVYAHEFKESQYALAGQLPAEVLHRLKSQQLNAHQVRFAMGRRGTVHTALVMQAGSVQVVFVVPMASTTAQAWLNAVTNQGHEFICAFVDSVSRKIDITHITLAMTDKFEAAMASVWPVIVRQPINLDAVARRADLQEAVVEVANSHASLIPSVPVITEIWLLVVTEFSPG